MLGAFLSVMGLQTANAQVPRSISYQGRLIKAGQPVNGTVNLTIKIYDASGAEKYTETSSLVEVKDGIFNILLGGTSGTLPATLDFNEQYFLGINVDGTGEMNPRTPFVAAPYALNSELVGGVGVAKVPTPGMLLPLDANGKLPIGVLPQAAQAIGSINGIIDGDVIIDAIAPVTVTNNIATKTITIGLLPGSLGNITSVQAGPGLTGGGSTGVVTLEVAPNGIITSMIGTGAVTGMKLHQGVPGDGLYQDVLGNLNVGVNSTLLAFPDFIGLNLASPNTWTALQTFNSGVTVGGTSTFTGNVIINGVAEPTVLTGPAVPPVANYELQLNGDLRTTGFSYFVGNHRVDGLVDLQNTISNTGALNGGVVFVGDAFTATGTTVLASTAGSTTTIGNTTGALTTNSSTTSLNSASTFGITAGGTTTITAPTIAHVGLFTQTGNSTFTGTITQTGGNVQLAGGATNNFGTVIGSNNTYGAASSVNTFNGQTNTFNLTAPGNVTINGTPEPLAINNVAVTNFELINNGDLRNNGFFWNLGNSQLGGTLAVSGNTTIGGTTTVTGLTTLNGGLNSNGTFNQVGTSNFTGALNQSGGNVTLNGPTAINNTLTVSGVTTVNNNLVVTGTSDLQGAISNSSATNGGAVTVNDAQGLTNLQGGINNTGTLTQNGNITQTSGATSLLNTTITGTLTQSGGNANIAGNTTNTFGTVAGSTNTIGGAGSTNTITGGGNTISSTGNNTITATGTNTITGGTNNINGPTNVVGNTSITGNLTTSGNNTLGTAGVSTNLLQGVNNTMTSSVTSTINGVNVNINGLTTINGNTQVNGTLGNTGNLNLGTASTVNNFGGPLAANRFNGTSNFGSLPAGNGNKVIVDGIPNTNPINTVPGPGFGLPSGFIDPTDYEFIVNGDAKITGYTNLNNAYVNNLVIGMSLFFPPGATLCAQNIQVQNLGAWCTTPGAAINLQTAFTQSSLGANANNTFLTTVFNGNTTVNGNETVTGTQTSGNIVNLGTLDQRGNIFNSVGTVTVNDAFEVLPGFTSTFGGPAVFNSSITQLAGQTATLGNVTVSNNLLVNGTTNLIGAATTNGITNAGNIGTTTLTTTSTANIGGALTVTGTSTLNGATTINNTLNVTGATTTNGLTNTGNIATGTLSTTGLASLNSANVATTLVVGGNTTLNTVTVTGLATTSNITNSGNITTATLTVTGASTVNGIINTGTLDQRGNIFNSTGVVNVSDDLTVTGATVTNGITNTGNIATGTLGTTGLATLNSLLVNTTSTFTGVATFNGIVNNGTLSQTGASTFNGPAQFNSSITQAAGQNTTLGNLTVAGTSNLIGATTSSSITNSGNIQTATLNTTALATLNSLLVNTTSTFTGLSTFNGGINSNGTINQTGTTNLTGALNQSGGNATIAGGATNTFGTVAGSNNTIGSITSVNNINGTTTNNGNLIVTGTIDAQNSIFNSTANTGGDVNINDGLRVVGNTQLNGNTNNVGVANAVNVVTNNIGGTSGQAPLAPVAYPGVIDVAVQSASTSRNFQHGYNIFQGDAADNDEHIVLVNGIPTTTAAGDYANIDALGTDVPGVINYEVIIDGDLLVTGHLASRSIPWVRSARGTLRYDGVGGDPVDGYSSQVIAVPGVVATDNVTVTYITDNALSSRSFLDAVAGAGTVTVRSSSPTDDNVVQIIIHRPTP